MLLSSERIAIGIILMVLMAVTLVAALSGTPIIWSSFATVFALCGGMAAFGLILRLRGHTPNLAALLFVLGLYPVFGASMSIATKLAFPLQRPLIDEQLFAMDRLLGYDWAKAVEWMATYPDLSSVLARVYMSSFAQILVLVIYLGLSKRGADLHRFLLTAMVATLMTTGFWFLWPSFGPSAFISLPAETLAVAGLVVTPDYGARLMDLASNGLPQIDAHLALGAIAFPSYHMFMAILVVWFARGTWLFLPALVLNIAMVPATLTHGGHHLIDLVGGAICFALALAVANRLTEADRAHTPRALTPAT